MWVAVNERDEIGPNLVPDYITHVREGAFYGWPYSYWGNHVDTRVMPQDPERVAAAVTPDYALGSHVAALGLAFSTPAMGEAFAEGVFVVRRRFPALAQEALTGPAAIDPAALSYAFMAAALATAASAIGAAAVP